jgi:hypothetical protein
VNWPNGIFGRVAPAPETAQSKNTAKTVAIVVVLISPSFNAKTREYTLLLAQPTVGSFAIKDLPGSLFHT